MKPEIPHRCWIDGTDWIWTDRALYDSCIDPRTASSERFLAKRDDLIMETLALEIGIPFFLVLAGGYQEPMEQKLVSLHLQTFRTAAKINPRLRKKIKLVGPYLSYQPWQDLRAMITKFLLLLGAPIRAIRPQNRSGRAFYRQGEFSF